jgi:hypothetical protein
MGNNSAFQGNSRAVFLFRFDTLSARWLSDLNENAYGIGLVSCALREICDRAIVGWRCIGRLELIPR